MKVFEFVNGSTTLDGLRPAERPEPTPGSYDVLVRVREVQQGPDGALYILLDDGRLIRVSRK